jgi:hypothetical protein
MNDNSAFLLFCFLFVPFLRHSLCFLISFFHFFFFEFLIFNCLFPWIVHFITLSLFHFFFHSFLMDDLMKALKTRWGPIRSGDRWYIFYCLLEVTAVKKTGMGLKRMHHFSTEPYGIALVEGIICLRNMRIQWRQTSRSGISDYC